MPAAYIKAAAGAAAEPVLTAAEEPAPAGPEDTLRVVKLRVLERHPGLPEGWACSKHWATNGPQYKQYTGPNGEVLTDQSLRQATRSAPEAASNSFAARPFATNPFAAASTSAAVTSAAATSAAVTSAAATAAATSAATSTPVAAASTSEVSNNCWSEIEVTADDLIQDHPPPSELVGTDVCVMAAAYPTHAFSRSGAVGWRGLVTHSRGGAVRVFGSWFRLADETFIKPIKEAEEEPALQEPEHAPSPTSTSQASVPALEVGQKVDARFGSKRGWFPGVVRHINEDGTLAIDYNDGDQEERVLRKHARQQEEQAPPRPSLPPTLSGRLRTAPQRLDASVLAAPQYGPAREASKREEPALHEKEEEEDEAASSPRPSSSARAVAVAVADEAEGLQLHLPASASSGGARTSSHGRFRGRVCRDSEETVQGSDGGVRHEGSAAVVVDEAEGLQLHLSASASSGYKGVYSIPSGRWQARICCGNNDRLVLGAFDTAVEAAVAYAHAASQASEGSASAEKKQATLTTAAAGSVLLSLATSPKRDHEQATKADPPAKRQRTDSTPPITPLLAEDQVRKLTEAKELKDKELIDEDEYKQLKAAIIGTVLGS